MNFDGYSCPKCSCRVTRTKRTYKCRCGWSYKEPEESYNNYLKRYFEKRDKQCARAL